MTEKILKKKASKVLSIFIISVFAVAVVVFAYSIFCSFTNKIPYFGKYASVRILTGSMETQIPEGSFILIEKVSADEVEVNDVIIFTSRDPQILGKSNTHRVIDISVSESGIRSFTTKGDNNLSADSYAVFDTDIQGRYIKNLNFITSVYSIVSKPWVFGLLIFIPGVILIAFNVLDVLKKVKEVKTEEAVAKEVERLKKEGVSKVELELLNKKDTND